VLVYPAPKTHHPYFLRDTSPLKIFEYMAAERPIISADLPPIRDVLDESTAYFFRPGDSADLARVIRHVMDNRAEAQQKAKAARAKVAHYTWEERMKRILDSSILKA
jgi:glycosyltransferase involved in cell wall biosynthesis